jgi:glycosyltransferase involved in cell wall biosynthesis
MKKICMVAYTNYLSDARPRREAETLVRRGDRVDFIALAEKDRPTVETVQGVRLFRVKQLRYRGSSGFSYVFAYLRFLCVATLKLVRLFWRERYDVVYAHTMPDFIVLAGLIPRLFGARIVLNIHDMMPELYMSKFGISEKHPLIRFLVFQEQLSIRLADKVICVHHPHREVLCKRGASLAKITVLPNVPDPLILRSDGPVHETDGSFRIVYHGTITRRLGLDLAVRAFAKVAGSCPEARLEIYGNGDAGDELEAEIEASGEEDRICFSKKMFRVESIAQMIRGASVGLIPNRRDVATDYMLPVKLLEYVHLGIPVIAPRLLAIQYYFGEDQVAYYEPGNVDELADCIRRLYADAGKRAELARKSAKFVREFNWETLKEELYRVIDDGQARAPEAAPQDAGKSTAATLR